MNHEALQYCDKAASHVAKGRVFYHKAVDDILEARKADSTVSDAAIGERIGLKVRGFGYSARWVRHLVTWGTTEARAASEPTPFSGDHENQRKAVVHTKAILRTAPLERVEEIISSLPKARQAAIAAAAGNTYLKAKQDQDEKKKKRTPKEEREQHEAGESLAQQIRRAVGGFAALGIIGHLEQAKEELDELNADASLTPEHARKIERAYEAFGSSLNFGFALLGEERDS